MGTLVPGAGLSLTCPDPTWHMEWAPAHGGLHRRCHPGVLQVGVPGPGRSRCPPQDPCPAGLASHRRQLTLRWNLPEHLPASPSIYSKASRCSLCRGQRTLLLNPNWPYTRGQKETASVASAGRVCRAALGWPKWARGPNHTGFLEPSLSSTTLGMEALAVRFLSWDVVGWPGDWGAASELEILHPRNGGRAVGGSELGLGHAAWPGPWVLAVCAHQPRLRLKS